MMIEILSVTQPIARKEHKCSYCNGVIPIGEKYENAVLKYDDLYVWKSHSRCNAIAYKLKMFDECDEGVTGDDFREYVDMEYYEIIGEKDDNKPPFSERLDIVCKYHEIT